MKKNEIKNSADMFLYKAIIDFNSARALMKLFENNEIDIDIEKVYFDLQQTTEKLIKSILSKHNIKFKKIHDIEELLAVCKDNNISLMDDIENLIDLTDYAVEGRYDIICDDIEDSDKYFTLVEDFIKFVQEDKK